LFKKIPPKAGWYKERVINILSAKAAKLQQRIYAINGERCHKDIITQVRSVTETGNKPALQRLKWLEGEVAAWR
jgi:hypothetical protein